LSGGLQNYFEKLKHKSGQLLAAESEKVFGLQNALQKIEQKYIIHSFLFFALPEILITESTYTYTCKGNDDVQISTHGGTPMVMYLN
jgi:hypothetical protein